MKILVVDDERAIRGIMVRGLRREGHDAYAAETAEDAEAVLADHPDIPLVLADIRLPGRSGLELLQAAKARNPQVEVALMTGYAGLDSAAEAVGAHAFAYLRKPLRLEEVLAVVDQVGERLAMRKEREQHRRELEQLVGRLEMSEERYRTLVEGIPGAAILTDSELVVRSASRRCRDVLGRSPDELVGTRIDALRADDADAFRERVERLRRGAGTVARFEGSVKHPERSRVPTVEVITSVAAGDAGSGGVFWIVQDASTEQALRREAERARDYLAAMRRSRSEEVEIVGESRPIKQVLRLIKDAAPTGAAVLVTGETGTGKELVAESIHINSDRADEPFVVVNCAALPETLLESELFGYRKGAFTGAVADKPGLVEIADGGTLFVDEVGDMALSVQSKLLRVLERGQFRRLGATADRAADIRVVAATHRDLEAAVRAGRFREDLFYRLDVIRIELPPLRDRRADIPLIARHLLRRQAGPNREPKRLTPAALNALMAYDWPGNVRELSNVIERAVILSGERPEIGPEQLSIASEEAEPGAVRTLEELEMVEIDKALALTGGNKTRAAEMLGITRQTLTAKLKRRAELNAG